jgi:hypothetical protein
VVYVYLLLKGSGDDNACPDLGSPHNEPQAPFLTWWIKTSRDPLHASSSSRIQVFNAVKRVAKRQRNAIAGTAVKEG